MYSNMYITECIIVYSTIYSLIYSILYITPFFTTYFANSLHYNVQCKLFCTFCTLKNSWHILSQMPPSGLPKIVMLTIMYTVLYTVMYSILYIILYTVLYIKINTVFIYYCTQALNWLGNWLIL